MVQYRPPFWYHDTAIRDWHRDTDDRWFWMHRGGWWMGNTSMHVARWALLSLAGIAVSLVILIRWPDHWYLTWNLFVLPILYTYFNLAHYLDDN